MANGNKVPTLKLLMHRVAIAGDTWNGDRGL